jgi:hypothetical protein
MWWPGPTPLTWQATHASAGATAPGTLFAAAGLQDPRSPLPRVDPTATYLLIGNTSPYAGQVKVSTYNTYGIDPVERTYAVPPSSRLTVRLSEQRGSQAVFQGSAIIESLGPTPAEIVVEQATYVDVGGVPMRAGTNAPATRLK